MHIAFWSPGWPLEKFQNGIVTYVHWMKVGLEGMGHRVSIFTGSVAPEDSGPGIYFVKQGIWQKLLNRVHPTERRREQAIFALGHAIAAEISRVHKRDPIDIIDMEESFGWHAIVKSKTSIPVFVKLHGPGFLSMTEDERKTRFGQEKIRREGDALRSTAFIASPTYSTLKSTLEYYELSPHESVRIVNPSGMSASVPVWDLKNCDQKTILFVGRFDIRKGGDLVLQAFRILLEMDPELKLNFVGPDSGLINQDGSITHIKDYIGKLFPAKLAGNVRYLGRMANDEITLQRIRAMVTVIASRWENLGYTLLEAMFQGCPVVSTNVGGCGECVRHGQTGLLARPGESEDLARNIATLLISPEMAAKIGREAREFIAAEFSHEAVLGETIMAYRRLMNS